MKSDQLLFIILFIVFVQYFLDTLLSVLNHKARKPALTKEAEGIYDEEKYAKSMRYGKENARFGFLSSFVSTAVMLSALYFGFFGWLDQYLHVFISHPIFLSLVFFALIFLLSDLLGLPFQWYDTFVLEEKYGFNKITPKLFFADKLKSYLLTFLIGGLLLGLLLWIVQEIGSNFWWIFWLVASAFSLLMNMFYTSWIVPLFNKLSPLPDGELKSALEEYCRQVQFPLDNLFVIDGSKRSSKANAFFSGIGKKKKVVLYDTLINAHSTEELVAVLAHEVGHYKKRHIFWSLLFGMLQTGLILYLLSLVIFNEQISLALGGSGLAIHLNLLAFGILFSPLSMITGVIMNIISRKNEFEADEFAAKTYKADSLQSALKKLASNNLSNLYPHNWYVFFHYSHPPLLARLAALNKRNV
jgi:STE24 endopeptidase